jgi:hypothetical protein
MPASRTAPRAVPIEPVGTFPAAESLSVRAIHGPVNQANKCTARHNKTVAAEPTIDPAQRAGAIPKLQ